MICLLYLVKHLPFAGEPEFFLTPLNQQRFELLFEGTDLLADGRLCHLIDLGRFGETLRFGQIAKNFKAFNLHIRKIGTDTDRSIYVYCVNVCFTFLRSSWLLKGFCR